MSSSLGFGTGPWGNFPWGNSDWAEKVLWDTIPEFYKLLDTQGHGRVQAPLRGFIESIKPPMEELRGKIRDFPALWNADEAPVDHLPPLARVIGLQPSTDKSDVFQRLEILNANQLYIHKGTDKGYRIIASFEGLDVIVEGLWAENCEPNAALTTEGPEYWIASYDDVPADDIHMDTIYDDRFSIWPYLLITTIVVPGGLFFDATSLDTIPLDSGLTFTDGKCRSYSIRLTFYKPDDTEIDDFNNVSRRIIRFVEFMKPIHVVLDDVIFDGPKASTTWTQSIKGDNPASMTWVSSISGALQASSTWVTNITADLVG